MLEQFWKDHQGAICIITAYIGIVSIFVSFTFIFFEFSLNFWMPILFNFGFLLSVLSLVLYLTSKFENNFWPWFYITIFILTMTFSIPIVIMNLIDSSGIQKILESYITINLAILSFTFAGIALNKDILPIFKKESPKVYSNFQNFIILTGFTLMMLIFIYCLSFFKSSDNNLMSVKLFSFDIMILNVFFWVMTVFTFISIANMMYYTWIISNSISDRSA